MIIKFMNLRAYKLPTRLGAPTKVRVETFCVGTGDGVPAACARKWAFLPVGKARCLEARVSRE